MWRMHAVRCGWPMCWRRHAACDHSTGRFCAGCATCRRRCARKSRPWRSSPSIRRAQSSRPTSRPAPSPYSPRLASPRLASPRLRSTPHTGAHARAHTQLKTTAPPLRPVHSRYALSASPPTCTAQRRPGGMAYSGAQAKYAHFVLSGQCLALALGKPVRDKPCRPRIVGSFQFGELIPELPADILQEPPPPPLSPSLRTRTRTQRRTCPQLLGRAFLWTNSDFGDGHFWRLRDAVAASG